MKTLVISAFPTMGKTTFFNTHQDKYKMLDSSMFSWIKDEHGNNTSERNSSYISDYLKHIKTHAESGEYDIIFVSSHKGIRDALEEYKIPHFLVYPDQISHAHVLENMRTRGDNDKFISFIDTNFERFIQEMDDDVCKNVYLWKYRVHTHVIYPPCGKYIDEQMIAMFRCYLREYNTKNYDILKVDNINRRLRKYAELQNEIEMALESIRSYHREHLEKIIPDGFRYGYICSYILVDIIGDVIHIHRHLHDDNANIKVSIIEEEDLSIIMSDHENVTCNAFIYIKDHDTICHVTFRDHMTEEQIKEYIDMKNKHLTMIKDRLNIK